MGPQTEAAETSPSPVAGRVGLRSRVRVSEERRASVQRSLHASGLNFFEEPLWDCSRAAALGPFENCREAADSDEPCHEGCRGPQSESALPIPTALFVRVALFLCVEDVWALSAVCRRLRWLAYDRTIWQSLCFSEQLAAHSTCPVASFQRLNETLAPRYSRSHALYDHQFENDLRLRESSGVSGEEEACFQGHRIQKQARLRRSTVGDGSQPACSAADSAAASGSKADRRDRVHAESARRQWCRLKRKLLQRCESPAPGGVGVRCRGLQILPGCSVEELVDWRFVFALNRTSPGPRIFIRVRDLELRLPLHPVVPDLKGAVRCRAGGGETAGGEGPNGAGEEQGERQHQGRWGAGQKWLSAREFVAFFVQRAVNIRRPMRLRHLRPGGRPGLCVLEVVRDQHYLLEWKVPLQCLLEPAASFAAEGCRSGACASLVWPLPPYWGAEDEASAGTEQEGWWEEKKTIYSPGDDDAAAFNLEATESDADDRLFYDVLDRGSGLATLLSPLSYRSTAVSILVGATLVAVATASATAALFTAAAAAATLAVRNSSFFRGDLHVIERDEHEDDQEGTAECDVPAAPRIVPPFPGPRSLAVATSCGAAYELHERAPDTALAGAPGQPLSSGGATALSKPCNSATHQTGDVASQINSSAVLVYIQELLPIRLGRLLLSSTVTSFSLTERSFASAVTVLTTVSKGALATASAAFTTASTAFVAVLLPHGAAVCVAGGDDEQKRSLTPWVRRAGERLLKLRFDQLAHLGLQADAERKKRADLLLEPTADSTLHKLSLGWSSDDEKRKLQRHFRQPQPCELRRCDASEDSAVTSPSLELQRQARSSSSLWLKGSGHVEALRQRRRQAVPSAEATHSDCTLGGPSLPRLRAVQKQASFEASNQSSAAPRSVRLRAQRRAVFVERPTEGGLRWPHDARDPRTDECFARRTAPEGETQGQRPTDNAESTAQSADAQQLAGFLPSGRLGGSIPWQPCHHGLLLFVKTCLPRARQAASTVGLSGWSGGAAAWDVPSCVACTALPEDVPLLLPTDATAGDLLRLLFVTLVQRNYVLPLIATGRKGAAASDGIQLRDFAGTSACRRSRGRLRGRSSSPTCPPQQALLHFWFASTQLCGEHDREQPLPSTKLLADVRLTSCERLSLSVLPFVKSGPSSTTSAHSLTLICSSRDAPRKGRRPPARRTSTGTFECRGGLASSQTSSSFGFEAKRLEASGLPWTPLPHPASAQDGRLMVVMSIPREGEPILLLRREGGPGVLMPEADLFSKEQGSLHFNGRPNASEFADVQRTTPDSQSLLLAREPSSASSDPSRVTAPQANEPQLRSRDRADGLLASEEVACRPWILRASFNSRQFEFHPQRTNVMLTGNNDGTVRLLDWERDIVLGTKLVDSHPMLGLSWLNHHPELFVCAAGVSGIPYVVRWREQDDCFPSSLRNGCTRNSMLAASALPAVKAGLCQSPRQQQLRDMMQREVGQEDQYTWDREDVLDSSTMAAALTWFRGYGGGGRMIRGGMAPLRIVHQYCAREELSSVSVNCTDDYLLVSGRSPDLTIHDVATGARLGTLDGLHAGSINGVRFAHTSPHLFVTASFDQMCKVWDLRQRINGHNPLLNVEIGTLSVMCSFDDSDQWLLCSGVDAALRQGGREFITAGTEEGFFRVFSRLGHDLGVVGLEGMLRPFARLRSSQRYLPLPVLPCDLLSLHLNLRAHVALGLSAMGGAALATAAGVSRSSVANALRIALRHFGSRPAELVGNAEALARLRQAVESLRLGLCISLAGRRQHPTSILQEDGAQGAQTGSVVEEYVQSLRAHPHERRLVGALLAAKDQVETAQGELSFVALSQLPSRMLA